MSERKVLSKYYPPDFDPSKIGRAPRGQRSSGPRLTDVRLMAPFSMKCTSCGEYIYKGRKFNARKETTDEKYLAIVIYRFYIKCTRCSGEITFKTDPKNMDYTCERGAKRNFERWRDGKEGEIAETDEERLDRLEREEVEAGENEERNAMEELEEKMAESKREMKIADALDEIRTRNARRERGERGGAGEEILVGKAEAAEEKRRRVEREDEEAAARAFEEGNRERVLLEEQQEVNGTVEERDEAAAMMPPPSFERVKKVRKPAVAGLIKKQDPPPSSTVQLVPVQPTNGAPPSLGLAGYGSDSD